MIEVTVKSKVIEAADIAVFELEPVGGGSLPPFSAGAHIDVQVGPGLVRQYSLCNAPDEHHRYLIGVLRDPGSRGGSRSLHDNVHEGAILQISEPRNHFPLVKGDNYLLFAGGIGVTPILCMAQRLAAVNARFTMHYNCRSSDRAAFAQQIASSEYSGNVQIHFDDGPESQRLDTKSAIPMWSPALKDTHLYVCGPGGYIDFIVGAAKVANWPTENVHLERFSAQPMTSGADAPFSVKLASTGKTYEVPAGRTVTQALADHGVAIPVSCEQGVCGACITRILDGLPDHRDAYFTEDEHALNDQFTPCCSRSKSPVLVLDL
ncbi:PDR/VanB family oxidoreductase [Paraburkholderia sp. CNPSo 3281]|uniref:PDR/VanB family oxidoreductase n=1 Tax=Paraburkholderia sp. CNPSo 3281 TaxID=2940933 RepID=UPI0020B78F89|nr:PDR/VanB family oxidoreductase [Paraburkholderia sp. CNPSo 3281]MCP3720628.1 PDR/VanB family oxidoreductase [Paraburkholderia sp. CNPSo 3281]